MKEDPKIARGPRVVNGWVIADAELPTDPLARLVYYARLAPSSHNSQPWKFVTGASEIDVFAEQERWLRVADADRREMYLSLGCAIEALCIAADYAGHGARVSYFPVAHDETLVARVSIAFGGPKREDSAGDLLKRMATRRTSHRLFERARPVSEEERTRLERSFAIGDVALQFLREPGPLAALGTLETRADALLFANPAYRTELARWVGEGMMGTTWLFSKLGQFALGCLPVGDRVARDDSARLASAPLVGLLTTSRDRRVDQVQAGQAYMRLALVAESREVRVQPMSQVLEVGETRAGLAQLFDLKGRTAQHLFRLGHAEAETHPPQRRPLASILIR